MYPKNRGRERDFMTFPPFNGGGCYGLVVLPSGWVLLLIKDKQPFYLVDFPTSLAPVGSSQDVWHNFPPSPLGKMTKARSAAL